MTRVRSGKRTYSYLTLAESYRNESGQPRHRIVARLGEVSDLKSSGELERIVEALSVQLGRGPGIELSAESAPSYGAMTASDAYFSRLLLDELFAAIGRRRRSVGLSDAVFAMVANRLQDPSSKRHCVTDWLGADAALPEGRNAPSLDRLYRALDAVADSKDEIEAHLFTELCNLTNLDLRLVCYDLTSTYFEGEERTPNRFPSKAFGYSRDHRGDRPQIVIGLLVTSDGIPIAHHVFSGNTSDRSTLPEVMADLQARFGVGRIALVADRGLISEENLALVQAGGFDHVLATRLHRDPTVAAVLEAAASRGAVFVPVGDDGTKATEVVHESRRYVVVDSPRRHVRDDARRQELLAVTENGLIALAERVRKGRLVDPAKIGAASDRILRDSRCRPVLYDQDRPRDLHLGLRREGHGLRGGTPRRPLCDHDLARQQDRIDSPSGRPLHGPPVSRTALSGAEGLPGSAAGLPLHRKARARSRRHLRARGCDRSCHGA